MNKNKLNSILNKAVNAQSPSSGACCAGGYCQVMTEKRCGDLQYPGIWHRNKKCTPDPCGGEPPGCQDCWSQVAHLNQKVSSLLEQLADCRKDNKLTTQGETSPVDLAKEFLGVTKDPPVDPCSDCWAEAKRLHALILGLSDALIACYNQN